jgi:hypothetical protein
MHLLSSRYGWGLILGGVMLMDMLHIRGASMWSRVSVQVGVSPYLMSREMKQIDSMKLEVNNCY